MAVTEQELLSPADQETLLRLARQSIASGLGATAAAPDPHIYTGALARRRAVFVTLEKSGALRGCIGTLEASEALAVLVADCAAGAAFRDPRFPALEHRELALVHISISVLERPQPLQAKDLGELLSALQPGRDGLILEQGKHRATFLPQVWEQLPDPVDFVARLLEKAGLPADHWSAGLRFRRYGSFSFSESGPGIPGT